MPLGDMRDFEVAEGYPDIRGWSVRSIDGTDVGKVHELLVDADSMRTRYLDLRLTSDMAATPGDRDVLVPIGAARLDESANLVILPLHKERIGLLPPYMHDRLTRVQEYEIRRHFSLGEAAAAADIGASTASRNFYDDEAFDDRRFFGARRDEKRAAVERPREIPASDERDVRIAVSPDDSVVLKRGQEGHDEIIIRRPAAG
ncbi:MAG: PRC-barrel domain-containing protein [bacterium]